MLRESSLIMDRLLEDESFSLVSVTGVTLTKDLKSAKIFVSSLGDEKSQEDLLVFLKKKCKTFRGKLAQRLTLKYMPEISFAYDPSVAHGMHIESLLNEIHKKDSAESSETSSEDESI